MKAPIAEVPPLPEKSHTRQQPFLGLNVICGLNLLLVAVWVIFDLCFEGPDPELPAWLSYAFEAFYVGLGALSITPLWFGLNWGRRLTIGFCVFKLLITIPTEFMPDSSGHHYVFMNTLLNNIDSAMSLITLIWLLLPGVKARFYPPRKPLEATG